MGFFVANSELSDFMGQPLVSVIIPNYNYERYIEKCLESVISQDYPNIEIIVVDDGSTDCSIEVIQRYFPSVVLIQQENQGVSSARNTGILKSSGDYLAFMDADDFWDSTKISKQMKFLFNADADLVYSGVYIVSSDGLEIQNTILPNYDSNCSEKYREFPTRAIILLGSSNPLIKKSIISKTGLFDIRLSQSADWDFFRRISDHGKICKLEEPLTYYRVHNQNMTSTSQAFVRDTLRCISKMNLDDKNYRSFYSRSKVRSTTYYLLLKYLMRRMMK
jgi:glycosyltransferase involved in cell wall biosynthesis